MPDAAPPNPLPEQAPTLIVESKTLELQKLQLEIAALQRPWWTRPDHLQPIATFAITVMGTIVSVAAAFIGYGQGWFDIQTKSLDNRRFEANALVIKADAQKKAAQREERIADSKKKEAEQKEQDADNKAKIAKDRAMQVQKSLEDLQNRRSDLDKQNASLSAEQVVLKRQLQRAKDELARQTSFAPYPKSPNMPPRLGADVYPIRGKVVDEENSPVADVELSIEGDIGHLRLMTHTGSDGTYILNANSDTPLYRITFTKNGYVSKAITLPNNTDTPAGNPLLTGPDGTWTQPRDVVLHKKK